MAKWNALGFDCSCSCGPTGITVCSCTVPETLNATVGYHSYGGLDAYGNCIDNGVTSRSFDLTHQTGSIIIRTGISTVVVSGYWVSECITTSDSNACACGGTSNNSECFARFFFFCLGGHFYLTSKLYNADGHAGIGGPSCTSDPFTGEQASISPSVFLTGTCSPFSQSSGVPGHFDYILVTS